MLNSTFYNISGSHNSFILSVLCESASLTVSDCSFTASFVPFLRLASGINPKRGSSSEVTIQDSAFLNNSLKNASLLQVYFSGILLVLRSRFQNTTSQGHGSVVYAQNDQVRVTLNDSQFNENKADVGGVIYLLDRSSFSSNNCNYERNSAKKGGVVYAESLEQQELEFRNFIFKENHASESAHIAFIIQC